MSADIIILPVIRRERAREITPQEFVLVDLAGDRLRKVETIAAQLGRDIDEVAACLLNQAIDNLDSRILNVKSK